MIEVSVDPRARRELEMQVMIVFESMYGNTHTIADRIAEGFGGGVDVIVTPVDRVDPTTVGVGLLIVGGPTHVHGLTSSRTRAAAVAAAEEDEGLHLDGASIEPGLRDWIETIPHGEHRLAVAFDTRADASALVTGRASKGIARRLRHHGYELLAEPESFLVDRQNHLLPGEEERATAWGTQLAALVAAV